MKRRNNASLAATLILALNRCSQAQQTMDSVVRPDAIRRSDTASSMRTDPIGPVVEEDARIPVEQPGENRPFTSSVPSSLQDLMESFEDEEYMEHEDEEEENYFDEDGEPSEDWKEAAETYLEDEESAGPADLLELQEAMQALDEDEFDDRTLLDVFGEAAKEYLTQQVIPDTDVSCRWDWRSVRCEPACECGLDFLWGDYHLGRSCRLREDVDSECQVIAPELYLREQPVTRRVVSLVTQTVDILKGKWRSLRASLIDRSGRRISRMQHNVCMELWTLYSQVDCLPASEIPAKTIPERLLCGPLEFAVCEESIVQRVFS